MKILYRGLVLTLTVIMLLSVMCPVAALAEMGVADGSESAQTAETVEETDPAAEEPSSGNDDIDDSMDDGIDLDGTDARGDSSGTDPEEEIGEEIIPEPVVGQEAGNSAAQENNTEPAAGTTEAAAGGTAASNTQQKQESTAAGIQSAGGAAGKTAEASISAGSLSASDGSAKSTRTKTSAELFISAKGSDENGNGSFEAPFASIPAALNAARGMGVDAELCLLSNLSITGTVQILGMNVYLTSNEGAFTITRDDAFSLGEEGRDTAMFAIGSHEQENSAGGQLILEHVVLNEKGAKTDPVQEGLIAVYSGGKLILGEEAMLLNYGGNSAVYAGAGAEVTVSAAGWILDDMVFEEDGTVAILEEDGSTVIREDGCIVLSHGEVWEPEKNTEEEKPEAIEGAGEAADPDQGLDTGLEENGEALLIDDAEPENEGAGEPEEKTDVPSGTDSAEEEAPQSGIIQKRGLAAPNALQAAPSSAAGEAAAISFSLDAPQSISSDDEPAKIHSYIPGDTEGYVTGYAIPYTLAVNVGSFFGTAGGIAGEALSGADIQLTFTLDKLQDLYPETKAAASTEVVLTPGFSVMKVKSAVFDESNRTVAIELSTEGVENWKDHLDELKSELTLSLTTVVVADTTPPYPQKESVTCSAKVDSVSFMLGEEDTRTLTPSGIQDSATTKLLGTRNATLIYDPNKADGGSGGPGTESLPAETGHVLETSNVPTHTDLNGYPVIFLGWTKNLDRKVYSDQDTKPEMETTVTLEENKTVTVYAVYSYDKNEDGIPDVDQKLVTLGFDANGGAGAPAPMIKATEVILAGYAAIFDIPEKEPTRKYYTFLGWSEDENATEGKYKYNASKKADRRITISKDTCLYAVWEENPVYTLYFNGNGGTNVPAAQSARSENGVAELTITKKTPTRSGRTFVGWSTQRYGTAAFEPGEAVRLTGGNVTLFAVWERNGSSSGRAPKTGDESNVPLYAALAVGSAAAAYAVVRVLKKRRK